MPNSYAVAPGTIVGNQTVTGDVNCQGMVTASSGAGAAGHLRSAAGLVRLGWNRNVFTNVNDDGTAYSAETRFDAPNKMFRTFLFDTGVGTKELALPLGALVNAGTTAQSGNTAENAVYSTTIKGGELGAFGQIALKVYISTTAQGGVNSTVRVRLGGTLLVGLAWATVAERWLECIIANLGATNAQRTVQLLHTNGANPTVTSLGTAVDTTVDNTLQISIQNGANTDSHVLYAAQGIIIPSVVAL